MKCSICGTHPRKNKQTYCATCASDVKSAERDAIKRSGKPQRKPQPGETWTPDPGSDIVLFRKLKKEG
eukprot:9304304-Lingulodinium_polyedra.AAC.1